MTKGCITFCLAALLLFACPAAAVELAGPFQVKNQFPIFLYTDQPYLEPAALADSFSVSLSHSSLFVMEDSSAWSAHLDLELTELNFRYRRTVPGGIELGVDLPLVRATAGFLDRPLAWYHRAFGFGDYDRSSRPDNAFLYELRRNGMPVVMGENDKAGIGDLRVTAKKQLFADDLTVSVMGTVELPTGDAKVGYGNGSVDAGVALLMDMRLGQDALWYANLGAVFPGDLKAIPDRQAQELWIRGYGPGGAHLAFPQPHRPGERPDLSLSQDGHLADRSGGDAAGARRPVLCREGQLRTVAHRRPEYERSAGFYPEPYVEGEMVIRAVARLREC